MRCVAQKGADELPAIGASDVVIGDASNPNDVAKAMEGVSTIYHVGPTAHPDEKAMGLTVIEAAQNRRVNFGRPTQPESPRECQQRAVIKSQPELVLICLSPTIQVDILGKQLAQLEHEWWFVSLRNPAIISMPLSFALRSSCHWSRGSRPPMQASRRCKSVYYSGR